MTFAYPRFFESEHNMALAKGLVADKHTRRALPVPAPFNAPPRLSVHGLRHGIALYNCRANLGAFGDFQMITSPLTISEAELDELVDRLEQTLANLADGATRAGLL